ncbi:TIGR03862 family flavoprotein [Ramlibacter rhizophilus]|uniref:TIGR03862 family flavoprotein n=1 Tax=Ramlibacter rhizophilus TaxID=1781167 RepID=A0A4Z0BUG2_9BURK|nr:TIGR03862 family flavoprotein [Ramlibacter rhizophilus]TFZ01655.1 TIGR03862 family flavoprotein [Ramlibacter rhizophilus]
MTVAVIGAGPAGLAAAECLAQAGLAVHVFDAMPSAGRKFLLAGRGGLNLTHSEPLDDVLRRFRPAEPLLAQAVRDFGPEALRGWAAGLGIETFVGSSGRVFPREMKAAPLLRAWMHRLRAAGVVFHMRHRWCGFEARTSEAAPPVLRFLTPAGEQTHEARAVVLALGGASWPRLGSDGAWVPLLEAQGVAVAPLAPSNCGFDVAGGWSEHFASRHAGQPLKTVAIEVDGRMRRGEFVATATGIEGSLVYAASAALRERIAREGEALLHIDLLPARTPAQVLAEVAHPRGSRSLSSHLKSRLGLDGIKLSLLYECLPREDMQAPGRLAAAIKSLPLRLARPRPLEEAISTAGGVRFDALDDGLMLRACPGVFCAGEMLDWEAPTGGYLLTASFATGRRAAGGVRDWLSLRTASGSTG